MAAELWLVRHGETDWNRQGLYQGQADLPLNETGLAQARQTALMLEQAGQRFAALYSSPLLRARQTAEALVREAGFTAMIELMPELAPEADATDVLTALDAHGMAEGHALLIGHMPLLGHLAAVLAEAPLSFEPAQLVRIELADGLRAGGGTVALTLDPRG